MSITTVDHSAGTAYPHLLSPIDLRGVRLRNRIGLAPMTMYVSEHGRTTDFHRAHYATRAQTTGLVIVEATAVSQVGRVTPHDLGIWDDDLALGLASVARAIDIGGAVPGIQLSHGGRKACRTRLWDGDVPISAEDGGWVILGPSSVPFSEDYPVPAEMTESQIELTIGDFVRASKRALRAGFRFVELHAGHGRLFHSFLSPLSNFRTDRWGGNFDNRARLLVETVRAIREIWPDELPLGVRLSCVDWIDGGWSLEDSVRLATVLRECGVDLVDCSSGGIIRAVNIPTGPGYQVPFARAIREGAGVATAAVGLIHSIDQAEKVLADESADLVLLGRKLLLDPYVLLRQTVSTTEDLVPLPYQRGVRSLKAPEPLAPPEL